MSQQTHRGKPQSEAAASLGATHRADLSSTMGIEHTNRCGSHCHPLAPAIPTRDPNSQPNQYSSEFHKQVNEIFKK
jgi:hypothetical protein